jgi:hypothetical protein
MHFIKTYTFIFFLFVSGITFSQPTTFEKWYDFGAAEAGYCVQQTPDSGYVIAGRQGIGMFSSKILIIKTDKYGATQWSKLFGNGSNDQYAYYIINCKAGGYAVVGYRTGIGFVRDIYVLRLYDSGDTMWTKQYGTIAIEEGTCIQETADSGFVISFWDDNDSTGILKIDSVGGLLWWKKYKFYNGSYFRNVFELSSGGYVLAGIAQTVSGLFSQGILMRTDSLGDSLWVKDYGGISGEEFYEARETQDGNIIVGGISGEAAVGGMWGSYILKININGDAIWTKRFHPQYDDECMSIQQCADGGFILGGTSYINSDGNMYLMKLNPNGDSLWLKKFGGIDDEYGSFVRQTSDDGYVLVGSTLSWDITSAVYLVKTNSVGNITTGINSYSSFHSIVFNAYPNPTRDIINLKYDSESDYTIHIIDVSGKTLFSKEILKNNALQENSIDISFLQNGIYYLRILNDKTSVTKKIIKIN